MMDRVKMAGDTADAGFIWLFSDCWHYLFPACPVCVSHAVSIGLQQNSVNGLVMKETCCNNDIGQQLLPAAHQRNLPCWQTIPPQNH